MSVDSFDLARTSYGTDEDIIFVHAGEVGKTG